MKELWLRLVQQSESYKDYVTISALGTTLGCLDQWYTTFSSSVLCKLGPACSDSDSKVGLREEHCTYQCTEYHWIASKNNPKKLSQKQLPCQPLHNPVYLSHMLCKDISLLNLTESTSNLLKREQNTMNTFWSGMVQYLWPFFPTTVMLQIHFMWVDLVRQASVCKTLRMQQSIMSTLPEKIFWDAPGLDWAACLNIRLNPF